MGKALYREYRPTSLDEVVGQEHITNTLRNAIKKGAISHAYLFTGPRGVGKTSVARILAHEINGLPYNEETTHLDIIEIDAASNRRIDEIRDLRDKVHIAPTSATYKVYIIDEVHMLTREAFNALLKTLEEPPAHVVFILATTESHKVPETIISRTQRFSFKPIEVEAVVQQLKKIADKEHINIELEALKLIAEHGGGSFRDSISMLDQIAGFSLETITTSDISMLLGVPDEALLRDIVQSASQNTAMDIFSATQKLRENGANPSKTAQQLIKVLRDELVQANPTLEPQLAVKLMKDLLPLTGTYSSFEALEIALLDAIETLPETQTRTKSVPEKVAKVPTLTSNLSDELPVVDIQPIETLEKEPEVIPMQVESAPTDASWNDVLHVLKSKHNTLYGVLRMADTKVDGEKIILTFQFEFHKKQLQQAKNIATLKAIVDEHLGNGYTIETEVVKKQPQKEKPKIVEKADDTLSNVSNIFGGAELLES
jgi:DNA polymerase-3 subunit gamma/tau